MKKINQKIFIIIPAFNEDKRLLPLVKKIVKKSDLPLVIVDDGSFNPVILQNISGKFTVLRHQINLGKGAAMKTGAEYAFSHGAEAVIFMDGDGQHDPGELPVFTKYLNRGYDLVFGSRRPGLNTPLIRYLGNKFASLYIRLIFGVYISDILSGFRAVTKNAYNLLYWDSARYGVETEMVARLGKHKNKLKWTEFPIESIYQDKYKGVTLIQAVKILGESLWWKLF